MSEKDVVENVDSPGEISIPIADNSTPGIASFDSNDFTIGTDGKVSSIVERGIPQYLGKITGTGTGTTDLNWKVDMNTVKQNKPIKLGEYIMLTEHFNQFVPGDIFRITSVQIEGSKYTVKTNNVRALSLASIVGPQGEQGNEGPQGVPYLAYTNSIESTVDPAPSTLMYLDDGHFNRTPIATSDTYRDVVTVDWYNKTTHRAFMVTGLIQGKNNATNQWVADITAATDITGAVGPQGKEGAGIADIVDIDYPHGEFTSVQYDITDGIRMQGIAKYLRNDGETYEIPTDIDVPIVAGEGLSMDKKVTEEKVEIKSLNSNLENGTGESSLRQKYVKNSTDYSAQAAGENAAAFGGKRWDMLTNSSKTPTSAEGKQSFAAGGSVHAIGDFSAAFGKDTVARQRASFAAGSSIAGMTEEEFNKFFWDSTNNVGIHGGSKNDSGQICDFTGAPYERAYAFATALGCDCTAKCPRSFAAGDNAKALNTGATATGARTTASGTDSFATGADTIAAGDMSFTANQGTKATGVNSSAFGVNTKAAGNHSVALGEETQATAPAALAEGYKTTASGEHSHAGGGQFTEALGANSFAHGANVHANAENSSAFGYETVAHSPNSFVVGKDNKLSDDALFIVGNGVNWNNRSTAFEVLKDGRAKVQTAPKESTDVVRLEDIKNMSATIVDLGRSTSMTGADYTKLESNENTLLIYDGVVYRRSRGTNYGYDEMQFESIDDSVQTATIYITNCVVTAADEAAGVISVTDTAGLKVGMTIMFTTSGGSVLSGISYRKIASIDTENKKIAMDGIVIDSDTLTDGSFIAVKANATSINLTNCVVTTADEAAGVISVTDGKSLTIGMYIDFRTSGGSRLAGISNRKIIAKDTANNKITVSGTVIDSDTLTNGCYITLANDIGFNKIYNRVLRIGKQKPDSTTAYIRYAYIPIGGLPITPSTATSSATSGTFTDSEWSKLQANDNNYILFNNEIYRLADKAHSGTTGIWSYTHTGWDGTAIMDKSINVTVSTGAWTLVIGSASAGGKLYLHSLLFKPDSSTVSNYYLAFYSTFYTNITRDNVDTYSSRIPFSILYHVDNSGNFLFDGIIHNIQQGPPPKNLVLAYPGISNIVLEFISDSVVEV